MALWILTWSGENSWFLFILVKIRWLCSEGGIPGSSEPQLSYFFLFESNYNINSFFDVSTVWCCASYFSTVALNFSWLYKARNDLWGFSASVWCMCSFIYFFSNCFKRVKKWTQRFSSEKSFIVVFGLSFYLQVN